jgi:hypothetical protein
MYQHTKASKVTSRMTLEALIFNMLFYILHSDLYSILNFSLKVYLGSRLSETVVNISYY